MRRDYPAGHVGTIYVLHIEPPYRHARGWYCGRCRWKAAPGGLAGAPRRGGVPVITPPRRPDTPAPQPAAQPIDPPADKPRDPLVIGRCLATVRALRAARGSLMQAHLSAQDDAVLQAAIAKLRASLAPTLTRAERLLELHGGTEQQRIL